MIAMTQPSRTPVTPPTPQQVQSVKNVAKTVSQDLTSLKAGFKTSEFWIHLALQALVWGVTLTSGNTAVKIAGVSVSAVLGTVYTLARTYLKSFFQ